MIRSLALAAAIFTCGLSVAPAREIARLRAPFFGCTQKSDIEHIARLAKELPRGAKADAVRAYGRSHCIALSNITATVDISDGDYVCLHRSRGRCLWTLKVLVDTMIDDGVF